MRASSSSKACRGKAPSHKFDPWNVPGCTYCHPQVASVGLTEETAKESGRKIKVGKFPFIGNGKAIALGEPEGIVKTIFDAETGELLGAHMVGEGVTELIQGYCIARQGELTEAELMETVFPHPTLSEMMHESVLRPTAGRCTSEGDFRSPRRCRGIFRAAASQRAICASYWRPAWRHRQRYR